MAEYSYNSSKQLTEHFNVKEFRCKCGRVHNIIIDESLVNKLESLYSKLNCSKIIINSGHRCRQHDINVGGNGSGQHVLGKAADIVCYDNNNKIISSKLVSCLAQDCGFGGIANIDKSYNYTHVDVRTSNLWFSDESLPGGTNKSITNDFYKYYNISKKAQTTNKNNDNNDKQNNNNKNLKDIANKVIAGLYGNGEQRKQKLEQDGYVYSEVQEEVNRLLNKNTDLNEVALDVIKGKYGNGNERKQRLEKLGYDYNAVQLIVNNLLK